MIRRGSRGDTRLGARHHSLTAERCLVSDLDCYLAQARDLLTDLDRHLISAHALLDLDRTRDLARDLDLVGARALGTVFFSDPALARDLTLARDFARDLVSHLVRDRDLDFARGHARNLVSALDRALGYSRRCAVSEASAAVGGNARPIPDRVPRGMIALAVRLLPVAQRPRYREEFSSELLELPRRARWGHALRVLVSAGKLRDALADTVRTPDGEPVRRAER